MTRNGKLITLEQKVIDAPLPAGSQESEQALDAILDADFSSPTKLKIGLQYFSKHNPAFRFYREVQPKLAQWWEEFSKELDQKTGGPKYKTIFQFARSKSKVPKEQKWITMMIGPEPAMAEQIDALFGGQCVDLAKGPDKKNIARFYTYFEMHKAVTIIKLRLLHEWRLTHGINMLTGFCAQNFLQINQNFGTAAGIADGLTNEQLETIKLARMLQLDSETFDPKDPEVSGPVVKKDAEKVSAKGTGKVM